MGHQITFTEGAQEFEPKVRRREHWFDSSYTHADNPVGRLRFPAVNNANYPSKHPIQTADGAVIGHLVDGMRSLGYTYSCVYVDDIDAFIVSHIPYGASSSYLSLIAEEGGFLFGRGGKKFQRVKSFDMPESWVGSDPKAFKIFGDNYFLHMTSYGFMTLSILEQRVLCKVPLDGLERRMSGFDISPKAHVMAATFCKEGAKNPLNDDWTYRSFVRLYHLTEGTMLGEYELSSGEHENWSVFFSEDGMRLLCKIGEKKKVLALSHNG